MKSVGTQIEDMFQSGWPALLSPDGEPNTEKVEEKCRYEGEQRAEASVCRTYYVVGDCLTGIQQVRSAREDTKFHGSSCSPCGLARSANRRVVCVVAGEGIYDDIAYSS